MSLLSSFVKSMQIPFVDLNRSHKAIYEDLSSSFVSTLNSSNFILGDEVSLFEKEFASYCNSLYCVGVGSGLDAITLILKALGIGPGDEVIVPSNTFIATWLSVSQVGATPVPVEPNVDTYNLNPDLLAKAITSNTKAVIAVHLYGQTADIDPIKSL